MWRPVGHPEFVRQSFFRRVFVPLLGIAAVVCCTAALPIPCAARLVGDETKTPLEQEEERETQEQTLVHATGRQRLKSHQCPRRIHSAPLSTADHQRRPRFIGRGYGHRLSNGLTAPLVC